MTSCWKVVHSTKISDIVTVHLLPISKIQKILALLFALEVGIVTPKECLYKDGPHKSLTSIPHRKALSRVKMPEPSIPWGVDRIGAMSLVHPATYNSWWRNTGGLWSDHTNPPVLGVEDASER